MIELTDSARERFDSYLIRLRSALRGARSVEPEDVEQNVREHIEFALAGTPAPIGAEHLGAVLDRLGPPERWLQDEERPAWKRVLDRLRSGPDDWRLAYAAFGLFLASFLLLPVGGPLLLIPAFFVSRAYVALMVEKGEPIGARGWLVYPAMAFILLFVVGAILVGPPSIAMAWAFEEGGIHQIARATSWDLTGLKVGFVLAAFGAWWIIAAAILAALHRPLRYAFHPLLENYRRRHTLILAALGAVALAAILIL
jgi:hypothetical protein